MLRERARGYLAKVQDALPGIRGELQLDLAIGLTQAYITIGDEAAAEGVIPHSQTAQTGWHTFKLNILNEGSVHRPLARYHAQAGRLSVARQIIDEYRDQLPFDDESERKHSVQKFQIQVLNHSIDFHLPREEVFEALELAATLPDSLPDGHSPRDDAIKRILRSQWVRGETREVREQLSLFTSSWNRDEFVRELIALAVHAGEPDIAVDLLSLLAFESIKIDELLCIANAFAAEGRRDEALDAFRTATRIARSLQSFRVGDHQQARALCEIAKQRFDIDPEGAIANLDAARPFAKGQSRESDGAAVILAAAEASCGLSLQASKTCEAISSPYARSEAYREAAKACVEADRRGPVARWLNSAAKDAASLKDEWVKENSLLKVVEACVTTNEMAIAAETAATMTANNLRDNALLMVVRGHVRNKEFQRAQGVRNEIRLDWMRRRADQSIVEALAALGEFPAAFEITRKLDGPEAGETAEALIRAQIAAGDFDGATLTAEAMRVQGPTDEALRRIASARTSSGDESGAVAMLSRASHEVRVAFLNLGIAEGLITRANKLARDGLVF
jgi:hypothetical protein